MLDWIRLLRRRDEWEIDGTRWVHKPTGLWCEPAWFACGPATKDFQDVDTGFFQWVIIHLLMPFVRFGPIERPTLKTVWKDGKP